MIVQRRVLRLPAMRLGACLVALAGCAELSPQRDAAKLEAGCPALAGTSVSTARIGLPSGAATIDSARIVRSNTYEVLAGGRIEAANPTRCELVGRIAPVDPKAPPIQFQVNLPLEWNGKALQYGGGGLNGVLITGLAPLRDAPAGAPTPLARGYLTYGTDSGHHIADHPPADFAAWALNEEALVNFAYASYKKVRDVAVAMAESFYGRVPQRVYFYGGSEGGREGLTMAQRFPRDFDGIVSVVPVINWVGLMHAYQPSQNLQFAGGWIPPARVPLLGRAVAEACDGLDGIADGVTNNYHACAAIFDVKKLRCPGGADAGATCLSDAQIAMLSALQEPYRFPFPLANGVTEYPRWLWGAEDAPGGLQAWVTGARPPAFPSGGGHSIHWNYGNNVLRFFIARDAKLDPRGYAPERHRAGVERISALMDSTNPDLTAFHARGGRLLIRENMGDYAQSPLAGIAYFNAVVERMGEAKVNEFVRLYASSASAHSGVGRSITTGEEVPTSIDLLDVLDAWVSQGNAPQDTLVQVRKSAAPPFETLASRPLCRYPGYPHYNGYRQNPPGDPKNAASYACRESRP